MRKNYEKAVRRSIMTGNFKPSNLYGLQIEGFKSSAISPVSTLKTYERGINSSSLAAVFPFVRTFVMDEGGIMLGENKANGYPFIFNMILPLPPCRTDSISRRIIAVSSGTILKRATSK